MFILFIWRFKILLECYCICFNEGWGQYFTFKTKSKSYDQKLIKKMIGENKFTLWIAWRNQRFMMWCIIHFHTLGLLQADIIKCKYLQAGLSRVTTGDYHGGYWLVLSGLGLLSVIESIVWLQSEFLSSAVIETEWCIIPEGTVGKFCS